MVKKSKPARRQAGTPNKKNEFGRDERANHFRCTEGFNKVCAMLIKSGLYKSKSDIYHEALQLLAMKKNVQLEHWDFWVKKIQ
jgi:hypothetical protein